MRILGAFVARQRADHQVDGLADKFRLKIRLTVGRDVGNELFNDLEADFRVRVFAAAKFQGNLHLHVIAQKIDRVLEFDAEVVGINARA